MANPGGDVNTRAAGQDGLGDEQLEAEPTQAVHHIPNILPHERVFPIQIGCELFKLSGASISSDAPSYFSQYFKCQMTTAERNGQDPGSAIRTLYIDRDPVTFKDISLHLQGYHVQPRDATHFVRLFADAQFYHLPKLASQLHEESIFTTVGGRQFRLPRDLFEDPGNTPNFFTLGFAAFFSTPDDLFPGLDREGLLRPPSIVPPSVPGRSADVFAQLVHLLRGYPVEIRSDAHRAELLRDCRYFNFKGLEQRLIRHAISFNLARGRDEIAIRLKDILKSGVSVASEPTPADPFAGWVHYARPYVDAQGRELVLEIGGGSTRLRFSATGLRAEFFGEMRTRLARLLEVVSTKLNLPARSQPVLGFALAPRGGMVGTASPTPGVTPLSEDLVKVVLGPEASVVLDGETWTPSATTTGMQELSLHGGSGYPSSSSSSTIMSGESELMSRKRRRIDDPLMSGGGMEEWVVKTGQWRLRIQGATQGKAAVECCLVAVKLEAFSCESASNALRPFLGG